MCRKGGRRCPSSHTKMTSAQTTARNSLRRERYAHAKTVTAGAKHNKPWDITHPTHDPRSRIVTVDGSANIRTMQGMPTKDGGVLNGDRVLRGEAPYLLTSAGVRELVESGVTHFVDLRGDHERETEGNGHLQPYIDSGAVHVYTIPMGLSPEFLAAHPGYDPYADLGETYLHVIEGSKDQIASTLSTVLADMQADGGKVLIHCAAGKDRTSMVIGTLMDIGGAHPDAVVDDYLASASVFGPVVEKLRVRPEYKKDFVDAPPEKFTPNRSVMSRFESLVEARGGLRDLLEDGGMSAAAIAGWQDVLRG